MRFGEIDLPSELIEANRNGQLVIFVGAGASVGPPSNLPLFVDLARHIAVESAVFLPGDELEAALQNPDVLLGALEDDETLGPRVDVHQRVSHIISDPSSHPNSLHCAIAALASSSGAARIVTSNYDHHLQTELSRLQLDPDIYCAPALPMGDDFEGLVYLHGSLNQEPRRLVVTDADFGAAYLRDAWAARFLERMFATFTVLFIGYSHEDSVMKYLGRSLPSRSRRIAIVPESHSGQWRQLAIQTVTYPNSDGSHSSLPIALQRWSEFASADNFTHATRIRSLVSGAVPTDPESLTYLESSIADDVLVSAFAAEAGGSEWLEWIVDKPAFVSIFSPSSESTTAQRVLAGWFAERYILNDGLSGQAMRVANRYGGRPSRDLWLAIAQGLFRREPRPVFLGAWITFLIQSDVLFNTELLDWILQNCRLPEDKEIALLLLRVLTTLRTTGNEFGQPADLPGVELTSDASDYWLNLSWQTVFLPHLELIVDDVMLLLFHQFSSGHSIERMASNGQKWDSVASHRPQLGDEIDDSNYFDVLDVMIAMLTKCVSYKVANSDDVTLWLKLFSDSQVPILNRVGIFGWRTRTDVTPSQRIDWLTDRNLIFRHDLGSDPVQLIQENLATSSVETRNRLLDAVLTKQHGEDSDEYFAAERLRFHILHQMYELPLSSRAVIEAHDAIASAHPDWLDWISEPPPELPTSGFFRASGPSPFSVSELHNQILDDVDAAVNKLREFEGIAWRPNEPSWSSILQLLTELVQTFPDDGIVLIQSLPEQLGEMRSSVIDGYALQDVPGDLGNELITVLRSTGVVGSENSILNLLSLGKRIDDGEVVGDNWRFSNESRELVMQVLASAVRSTGDSESHTLNWAVNTSVGKVAIYLIRASEYDRKRQGDAWTRFSDELRSELESLLSRSDVHGVAATMIIARDAGYIAAVDADWYRSIVQPLFDWADEARASRAWHSFLGFGQVTLGMIRAGILDYYRATFAYLRYLNEQDRDQLTQHLATIAIFVEEDPAPLITEMNRAGDTAFNVAWMRTVQRVLRSQPQEIVAKQWNKWIRDYWTLRLSGVPFSLTLEESSAISSWAFYLGPNLSDAVEFAIQWPARFEPRDFVLHDLEVRTEPVESPSVAKLVAHLLSSSDPERPWLVYGLEAVFLKLKEISDIDDLRKIVNEAIRLGYPNAITWLEM